MTQLLLAALVEKKAFVLDTIITASYTSKDIFGRTFHKRGDFKIRRVVKQNSEMLLELRSLDDNKEYVTISHSSILAIDGMDIHRYADIYDLLPDGTNKKVGKKRGRKPKNSISF